MNTTVLVTGGASGIGFALAQFYGQKGHPVALLDASSNVSMASEELKALGIDARGYQCDITNQQQVNKSVESAIRELGDIQYLFNNAGITQRSPFESTSMEAYRKVMEINFFGQLHVTQACIQSLKRTRGYIAVTSSIAGVAPLVGRTGYSASKHALHGFFETLAAEMIPHGVHVLVACPGFTKTNLQDRAIGGDGDVTTRPQSKVGKEASPHDLARIIQRALLKKKKRLVLTPVGKISFFLNTFFPGLYQNIMYRSLQSELEQG